MLQVQSIPIQFLNHLKHLPRVRFLQRLRYHLQRIQGEHAQQSAQFRRVQRGPAAGNRLIQCGERIPNAALTGLRQHRQRLFVGGDSFLVADPLHARYQFPEIHGPETELLAPRRDGRRNFMNFGRTQNEHHPLGRLLQRLQQRVEGIVRNLVRLVHDEDFVTVARRAVADILPQFAHLIDAAIGRRVNLDHVHTVACRHFQATGANSARIRRGAVHAIQAAGHNSRHGSLARAALAAEYVAVRNPPLRDRVLQRRPDMFLTYQFGKGCGTVFSGDNLIHGWELPDLG